MYDKNRSEMEYIFPRTTSNTLSDCVKVAVIGGVASWYDTEMFMPNSKVNALYDYIGPDRNNGHPFAAMYGGTPKRNKSK